MNYLENALTVVTRPLATSRALRSLLAGLFLLALPLMLLAGCSGGDVAATAPAPGPTTPSSTSSGYTLYLSLSKTSIKTDNSDSAEITATLTKTNAGQAGQEVVFTTTDGLLSSNTATTDGKGEAKITIKSGPGASNQLVSITATSNGASASIPLQITGNTLTLELPQGNMAQNTTQPLTATLKNAANIGIYNQQVNFSVTSGTGIVSLSPTSATTDVNGKATINVTAPPSATGTAIIEAGSLGASKQIQVIVAAAAQVFEIISPIGETASVETNAGLVVTVKAPTQANVTFASNLGSSVWNNTSSELTVPVIGGVASATLTSPVGGTATITVYDPLVPATQDTLAVQVYAPASEADNITLQLSQNNVKVTPADATSKNSVTLTAYVRNADNFAVGGALVYFTLADTTGGLESVSPGLAFTNSAGVATSTFYSGSQGSSGNGVKVTAKVANTAIEHSQYIIITDLAGSVAIGRDNKIVILNNSMYQQGITVQVADSNGSPVPSATVTLNLWPVGYYLGAEAFDENGVCVGYYHNLWPICTGTALQPNEDLNRNLIKDPGEDTGPFNFTQMNMVADGFLTPHNSTAGSIPAFVTTNAEGWATFPITYLKQYAFWVGVELTASVKVQGTEVQSKMQWTLEPTKEEFEACNLFPSIFGYYIEICP